MKEILISIQPKHVANITTKIGEKNGKPVYKKRIEVRKSHPSIETPFKCYIYCTYGQLFYVEYPNGIESKVFGLVDYKVSGKDRIGNMLNGKVIGEFICDRIDEWKYLPDGFAEEKDEKIYYITSEDGRATCLTYDEIENYGKGKTLYGWNISDLKIYDKPKELSEFTPICKYKDERCEVCCFYEEAIGGCCRILTRPPQSWQFVEFLGE